MTPEATLAASELKNGILIGPYRAPKNMSREAKGSIHDDATAQRLGFRGGTVAGSIHMEQFPPLLVGVFGPAWFERGGLSCYFRNATTHEEPVRALVEKPESAIDDRQVKVWMEHEDGRQVLEGTADLGAPAEPSMVRSVLANRHLGGDLRILAGVGEGQLIDPVPSRIDRDVAESRREVVTEPLDWYFGDSPWGSAIATPNLMVRVMRAMEQGLTGLRAQRAVGLFGAIEVKHVNGPVFIDHEYENRGKVLALGETPKSEFIWYESILAEPGGKDVASMIMMLRFMKASSELWRE